MFTAIYYDAQRPGLAAAAHIEFSECSQAEQRNLYQTPRGRGEAMAANRCCTPFIYQRIILSTITSFKMFLQKVNGYSYKESTTCRLSVSIKFGSVL